MSGSEESSHFRRSKTGYPQTHWSNCWGARARRHLRGYNRPSLYSAGHLACGIPCFLPRFLNDPNNELYQSQLCIDALTLQSELGKPSNSNSGTGEVTFLACEPFHLRVNCHRHTKKWFHTSKIYTIRYGLPFLLTHRRLRRLNSHGFMTLLWLLVSNEIARGASSGVGGRVVCKTRPRFKIM